MKTQYATATADNDEAVVNITTDTKETIYITHISAEFDGQVSNINITVEDGNTKMWSKTLKDRYGEVWNFFVPLKATAGNNVTATLEASGVPGIIGSLYVFFTKGE